jgi:hypothetical protein
MEEHDTIYNPSQAMFAMQHQKLDYKNVRLSCKKEQQGRQKPFLGISNKFTKAVINSTGCQLVSLTENKERPGVTAKVNDRHENIQIKKTN